MTIKNYPLIASLFFFSYLFYSTQINAIPATGEFVAESVCDMYQSKRKGTNPGNIKSKVDQHYAILEVLKNQSAEVNWVRVKTQAKKSPARWISATCGAIDDLEHKPNLCNTASKFDSNVLAISWQPAFCELKGNSKTECATLHPHRFDASHFSLHGLWPNKRSCGRKYGSCGEIKTRPPSFCEYPALDLTSDVRDALGVVMPSEEHGTCLQRHEWWKHGTCSGLSQDDYFVLSMEFLDQVNQSAFVQQFVSKKVGQTLLLVEYKREFEKSFGSGSFNKVTLRCSRGMLTEMQIALPKDIDASQSLNFLLSASGVPTNGRGNCGSLFKLDDAY